MKIIGLMPCRNEAWVVGLSARAALLWCDELVILNHASTDYTADIISDVYRENPSRLRCLYEPDPVWNEMYHRQWLLDEARWRDATHIALIDADEVLTANLLDRIRGVIANTPPHTILMLPWLCLRDGIGEVMTSGIWGAAEVSTAFMDDPRYHWAAQGPEGYHFHHRHPFGLPFRPHFGHLGGLRDAGMMHLQFSSRRRLLAKQYLYQLIERHRWPKRKSANDVAAYYGRTVHEAKKAFTEPVPDEWWSVYYAQHLMRHLRVDEDPWQLEECRRLIRENPGIESGLESFGVI